MVQLLPIAGQPAPEGHKECPECQLWKPLAAFGKHKGMRDGLQFYCRECTAKRGLASRQANPERHRETVKRSYEKNKAAILVRNKLIRARRIEDLLSKVKAGSCMDCGGRFPSCAMDFDHRPGEVKLFQFGGSNMVRYSLAKTMAEIAKCDLVCSNCHRVRTYRRMKGI